MGRRARVECDRMSVVKCESESDSERSLLGEVEDRGGGSGPHCYREVRSRVRGHGEKYAVYAKRSPGGLVQTECNRVRLMSLYCGCGRIPGVSVLHEGVLLLPCAWVGYVTQVT
jgi:hypothetical protein